jgi:hypothetical protein
MLLFVFHRHYIKSFVLRLNKLKLMLNLSKHLLQKNHNYKHLFGCYILASQ